MSPPSACSWPLFPFAVVVVVVVLIWKRNVFLKSRNNFPSLLVYCFHSAYSHTDVLFCTPQKERGVSTPPTEPIPDALSHRVSQALRYPGKAQLWEAHKSTHQLPNALTIPPFVKKLVGVPLQTSILIENFSSEYCHINQIKCHVYYLYWILISSMFTNKAKINTL